jgi:hypothetical protein
MCLTKYGMLGRYLAILNSFCGIQQNGWKLSFGTGTAGSNAHLKQKNQDGERGNW